MNTEERILYYSVGSKAARSNKNGEILGTKEQLDRLNSIDKRGLFRVDQECYSIDFQNLTAALPDLRGGYVGCPDKPRFEESFWWQSNPKQWLAQASRVRSSNGSTGLGLVLMIESGFAMRTFLESTLRTEYGHTFIDWPWQFKPTSRHDQPFFRLDIGKLREKYPKENGILYDVLDTVYGLKKVTKLKYE